MAIVHNRWMRWLLLSLCAFCLLLVIWVGFEIVHLPQLPDSLSEIDLSPTTVIYAVDGRPIDQVKTRTVIPLSQISPYFIKAILAAEDHRFYDHDGLDKIGLMRAVWSNIVTFGRGGGGSTITQQLAKNLFLSFERSYRRKIRDMLLAVQFEQRYTKDEILQAYCNQVNFGSGAYGIENAALTYFGKHAAELDITESAILASIPQSPNFYNLYIDETRVKNRYMHIINRMHDLGWISEFEFANARTFAFTLKNLLSRAAVAPHFIEMVKQYVIDAYDEETYTYGGLRIYTTLDLDMQEKAKEAAEEGLYQLDARLGKGDYRLARRDEKEQYPQAALVAIDPSSGAVRALVGGRDSQGDYYNRAFSARRSPGSAFKPVVYMTAINELGVDGTAVMVDSQVTYRVPGGTWTPENFEKSFYDSVTLKYAFMRSINTISAQLIDKVSPEKVVDMASRLGITTPLEAVPSLSLGSNGVSLVELASVYAAFAAGGVRNSPFFIKRIESSSGAVLEEKTVAIGSRVIDSEKAYLVLDLLKGVMENGGTGSGARSMGFRLPAGGKTGTTNDTRDAWFAGITPDLAAVAWVGYDDFEPMRDPNGTGITGAAGALPIWTYFMKRIEDRLTGRDFTVPAGIVFKYVDRRTGVETNEYDPDALRVAVYQRN